MSEREELTRFAWGIEGDECPPLSTLSTLEVGGRPRWYAEVHDEESARSVARWASAQDVPLWVIGGGSNILCADDRLEGVALQLAFTQIEWGEAEDDTVEVTAGAGVVWSDLVESAVKRELAGIECLTGIPGWVGAAPIQNIGAYGQELSDVCVAVRVYDRLSDETRWWTAEECAFAYRQSVFKAHADRYLIFAVRLALRVGGAPTIRYAQLRDAIETAGADPTSLSAVRETVQRIRAAKSMVWSADDPNRRSVGSFFLNPIISASVLREVDRRCERRGIEPPPRWTYLDPRSDVEHAEPSFKLPAAWLIEKAGFEKGHGEGVVGLSSAHTLALINRGGARAADIFELAREIQRGVWRSWGVWLSPEVRLITDQPTGQPHAHPLRFRPRVALVSCSDLPAYEVDDHPLWEALRAHDVELMLPVWDDEHFDWGSCDLVIPRTTWDYQGRWPEFLAWMREVDQETLLLNPIALMEWNLDKRYLRDLPIGQPPTIWLTQRALDGEAEVDTATQEVLARCAERGWERAFLKPHIAASAFGTLRFSPRARGDDLKLSAHLAEWLPRRTMLLQPYLREVEEVGERSLIYFNGVYSHSVRKVPVDGDYRVQDDYGASDMPWEPPVEWRRQCEALLSTLDEVPLYARCDFLSGPEGEPWLIELELIEPSLFFRHDPQSPGRFAEAILARCPRP